MAAASADYLRKGRLIPDVEPLTPAAARALLTVKLKKASVAKFNEFSALAKKGTLNEQQREDLEEFLRFGDFLTLLHSKARIALKRASVS